MKPLTDFIRTGVLHEGTTRSTGQDRQMGRYSKSNVVMMPTNYGP